MSGFRLATGGLIDRSRELSFTFDGHRYCGYAGDTLASALLAEGVQIVGRGFKYHRPRGLWGAWFDDPNGIFNVTLDGNELTNCPAAMTPLEEGMVARAVNAMPSAARDVKGVLDRFSRFLKAGFYYKTFMWPNWHLYEPFIRKMAGLGALDGQEIDNYVADQLHDRCDLLVIGAGPAGLVAAGTAAERGEAVVLVDDHPVPGGTAYHFGKVEGLPGSEWVDAQVTKLKAAGGRILTRTTAFGAYDHKLIALIEDQGFARAPRMTRMRVGRAILATGAIDRPVTFAENDLPGIMGLESAVAYLGRYGVLAGRRIAVMAPHSQAEVSAARLRDAGAEVTLITETSGTPQALGRRGVRGLRVNGRTLNCDTILTSAGLMPVLHLWSHAGGKLAWDSEVAAFLPANGPEWMQPIGAANGTFTLEDCLTEARAIGNGVTPPARSATYKASPPAPRTAQKRQWIDLQHDVTLGDIELAARENYASVEHLKRYTTLGMASDQGKTSNVAGLTALAAIQRKPVSKVGTTTFRPPFVPIPLETYRGTHRAQLFHPLKRLALEPLHRSAGAALGEYGGWLRPAWYGASKKRVADEVSMSRDAASILDASPLGKIEVMGPDAEAFVNFIYYNTIKTLKPGRLRYGFMLTEGGIVFDDGVIARLEPNRFVISCSSSHVESVQDMLEGWRQDGNDPDRVFVHDTTQHWATITVAGPKARQIIGQLGLVCDLTPEALPHMALTDGSFEGAPVRINRVSFTGEVSFELSVPTSKAASLWLAALDAGAPLGAGPIGLEALSILRAEKGYLVVGRDTDGETMPHDLGFGGPRQKKSVAFVGDRALHTEAANRLDRLGIIGLRVPEGAAPIPNGAHLIEDTGNGRRSVGYVTSSYDSPTLGHPIALARLTRTLAVEGRSVEVFHLGDVRKAYVVSPCFFDKEGTRLDA